MGARGWWDLSRNNAEYHADHRTFLAELMIVRRDAVPIAQSSLFSQFSDREDGEGFTVLGVASHKGTDFLGGKMSKARLLRTMA